MGKPVTVSRVTQKDFSIFNEILKEEYAFLKNLFKERELSEDQEKIGSELEFQLVDQHYQPANLAEQFIRNANADFLVPEIGQSNVEINTSYHNLDGKVFNKLSNDIFNCCHISQVQADIEKVTPVALGLLFSVYDSSLLKMYDMPRFQVMEDTLRELRNNKLINISVDGSDHLEMRVDNTARILAATNAYQLHVQIKLSKSMRFYNASQILAAPILACSVNSPYFLGKKLWQETRIPLLEQVSSHNSNLNRVDFGDQYLEDSMYESFLVNQNYPCLIPAIKNISTDNLWHLRLHGSTIYRWNRPIIGFDKGGMPHLRIECRHMPAGPSIQDMVANTALLMGSVFAIGNNPVPLEKELAFGKIKNNFYRAAKYGLDAELMWTNDRSFSANDLLKNIVIPLAYKGLEQLDVSKEDADYYLGIIKDRIKTKQTASCWLINFREKNRCTFEDLLKTYCENQKKDIPVHDWILK